MDISLLQFPVFTALEFKLKAVTPQQLADLEPGPYVDPNDVTVLGRLSDNVRAIMVLHTSAVDKARDLWGLIRRTPPGPQKEKFAQVLIEVSHEIQFLHALFWQAVRAEYPDARDYPTIGLNEKFEIFGSTEQKSPLDHLLGSLAG